MNEWKDEHKSLKEWRREGGKEGERGWKVSFKMIVVSSSRGYGCFGLVIWRINKIPILWEQHFRQ